MTDPTPDVPTPVGRPQGGMKSEEGRSAYWRMQWESAIGALADLIAEHTETVDRLETAEGAVARVDIEAVLSAHEYLLTYKTGGICTCGHVPVVDSSTLQTQQDYHRAHVATTLRAALAEVTP